MRGETAISKRRVKGVTKYSFILAILLYISLFSMAPCKAGVIWSDNFDDGNYDGWFVWNVTLSAEDHTLKLISILDNNYGINHLSTVTNGTWSFDILVGEGIAVWLTYDAVEYGLVLSSFFYSASSSSDSAGTYLRLNSVSSGGANVIGEYIFNSGISSWQHIDVTRNVDGRTCVYLNGTLCIDVVDHVARQSWFFMLSEVRGSAAIDNIVVSNTVDIEPPPPIPFYMQTWFLATVCAIAVAAAVAIIFLGRRKH